MTVVARAQVRPEPPAADLRAAPLAVIVVNYASHALLAANLVGPARALPAASVVVVDNFSTPQEAAAVGALGEAEGWHVVRLPDNLGFGAAVDAGLRAARERGCGTFLLLNPDAVAEPGVVEELWRRSVAEPDVLLSPRVERSDGGWTFAGSELELGSGRIRRSRPGPRDGGPTVPWLPGTCLVLSRQLLERVGPMDGGFFMYWEDVDFSYRCLRAGATLRVCDDLTVSHDGLGTQQRSSPRTKSELYYFYNCRNRLVFGARHLPRRTLLRWIALTPVVSWQILMQGGRRQLLHSPRPLLAAVRGSASGLAVAVRAMLGRGTVPR